MDMFADRPKTVDYRGIARLQPLGDYRRRLPVNMARMMENALDWEHLPHVHQSSFADIEAIDYGPWGWRARALPAGMGQDWQVLELLLDSGRHYWATRVIEGPAADVEIHTQATALEPGAIEVHVRFYSARQLAPDEVSLYREVLQQQYALLYDEDEDLMRGRQAALDARSRNAEHAAAPREVSVTIPHPAPHGTAHVVDTPRGRYCLRYHNGHWRAHSAVCPHLLGPLDGPLASGDGTVVCPWHGYRFDIYSGDNVDGRCRALPPAPAVTEEGGRLVLRFSDFT
jgi:nitrite reductase/ring-hydroxylating ferredoxin subunit